MPFALQINIISQVKDDGASATKNSIASWNVTARLHSQYSPEAAINSCIPLPVKSKSFSLGISGSLKQSKLTRRPVSLKYNFPTTKIVPINWNVIQRVEPISQIQVKTELQGHLADSSIRLDTIHVAFGTKKVFYRTLVQLFETAPTMAWADQGFSPLTVGPVAATTSLLCIYHGVPLAPKSQVF